MTRNNNNEEANEFIVTHEAFDRKYFFYQSNTINELINEIFRDNYHVLEYGLGFGPNDLILDLGANEGVFSIMMAKLFPQATIVACEPVQSTFFKMVRNIGLNGITNIFPINVGAGSSNRKHPMVVSDVYTGGSSGVMSSVPAGNHKEYVDIMKLDTIFHSYCSPGSLKPKLLKIDIEGMEYEALANSSILHLFEHVVGEFHINGKLRDMGYDIKELAVMVANRTNLIYYESCKMAE